MRRIQIYLDEDLDDRLGRVARQRGVSKSAVIRDAATHEIGPAPAGKHGWDALVGMFAGIEPIIDTDDIDEVVYGQSASGRKYGT